MMEMPVTPRCPVCKARFRGQDKCPRCGADLSRLMFVVACAQQLRGRARQALCEGRYREARELAGKAQDLHCTPLGHKIVAVAALLDEAQVQL
jgi:predicted amidophosphoribosyltransferase